MSSRRLYLNNLMCLVHILKIIRSNMADTTMRALNQDPKIYRQSLYKPSQVSSPWLVLQARPSRLGLFLGSFQADLPTPVKCQNGNGFFDSLIISTHFFDKRVHRVGSQLKIMLISGFTILYLISTKSLACELRVSKKQPIQNLRCIL